ncbi:MAE_28990/MAE_18760 family HEPN-like nuclease [Nocardia sp. CC201C]|uniref:MAE_28990/MAE_18760 family HEPN-like nuclease n=1 Tax=Nocardia sp. CC201C TaxID=3044575 RepID=UPI0024A97C06|nr:MAE_28990/MAE_18760 family HEPN-like nuclease [Nocardia sp. CC201C]
MDSESFSNSVYGSLARRKKELSDIRLKVREAEREPSYVSWISRAAIVLAYAHWEGFVKESSGKYLKLVSDQRIPVSDLHISLQAACLSSHFKRVQGSGKVKYLASILNDMDNRRCEVFRVEPEKVIDTESNLSSTVFKDLISGLGLESRDLYDTRQAFIDEKLLRCRNMVAHGELVSYSTVEADERIDGVLVLLDAYADHLIEAARDEKFLLISRST